MVQLASLDIDASWFAMTSKSKVMVILVILAILAILAAKLGHFASEIEPKIYEMLKLELKS